MKDNSLYKLGGICSVLVGISYVVIGVTELLLPPEYTVEINARVPLMFFRSNQALFIAQWSAMLWGAVFALAVIPAVSERVRNLNEGWVRWTSALATLGFAVTILDNYWAVVVTPASAAAYFAGSEVTKIAMSVPGSAQQIDVRGWLQWGAVGLWVVVVNLLALRGNIWPRALAYLGLATAVGYFLAFASAAIPSLLGITLLVAGIGGVVIGPIWYIWMGLTLYRNNLPQESRESNSPSVGMDTASS
jgi:uncharacterized protein DUF4386